MTMTRTTIVFSLPVDRRRRTVILGILKLQLTVGWNVHYYHYWNPTLTLSTAQLLTYSHSLLCRIACIAQMRPTATDVERSVVCVCVCVLITRMCPKKTAESIEMPFDGLTDRWAQGPCFRRDSRFPRKCGNFGDFSGLLKSNGSLCCGLCSERDHSILSNGMTADCNAPDWSVSH